MLKKGHITRPIGRKMIELLELCDQEGPQSYKDFHKLTGNKYAYLIASYACKLGLMTHDDEYPRNYCSVAGWRDSPYMPKQPPTDKKAITTPRGCSFIFNMGVQ